MGVLQLSSSFRFLDWEAGPFTRLVHLPVVSTIPSGLRPSLARSRFCYAPNLPRLDTNLGASYDDNLSQAGELGASPASEWPAIKTDK
jgi:hypothetical protein